MGSPLISDEILAIIKKNSVDLEVEPSLIVAICMQESGFNTWKTRYEPTWQYFTLIAQFAQHLGITMLTEQAHQKTSFGLMQVMGDVARELGYADYLVKLTLPEVGILYGTKKLSTLKKLYENVNDVISSYNQGSPTKLPNGQYKNQEYVDSVLVYKGQYAYLDKP